MSAYKDPKTNTWRVIYRTTDWMGNKKQTQKRGFRTKKEALEWEREQLSKSSTSLNMTFESFVELYETAMRARLKESTRCTKESIIRTKILPYFKKRKMNEIKAKDVIAWQNEMLNGHNKNGEKYSPVFLKTLHNQLSAIFNYAVKYYDLKENPAALAGNMGKPKGQERPIWTEEEYRSFSFAVMDKPVSFYAFEVLYWCGIREGELLALTEEDFDLENGTLRINKTYHRINGKDVITEPKTKKSNRIIRMPDFLVEEIKEYLSDFKGMSKNNRMFDMSKSYLHHEMTRGAEAAGVHRIRIHDLRHSHISLLIEMGYSPVAIAARAGHESINITMNYAHCFPSVQIDIANKLNEIRKETY